MLVGEHAVEHQDLLSLRMAVRAKRRRGVIAHDGGDPAEFAIDEVKALAPYRGAGARLPIHGGGVHSGWLAEVGVQAVVHGRFLPSSPRQPRIIPVTSECAAGRDRTLATRQYRPHLLKAPDRKRAESGK